MFFQQQKIGHSYLLKNASLPDHLKQYLIFFTACNPPPATATSFRASTNIPSKCENRSFQFSSHEKYPIHNSFPLLLQTLKQDFLLPTLCNVAKCLLVQIFFFFIKLILCLAALCWVLYHYKFF